MVFGFLLVCYYFFPSVWLLFDNYSFNKIVYSKKFFLKIGSYILQSPNSTSDNFFLHLEGFKSDAVISKGRSTTQKWPICYIQKLSFLLSVHFTLSIFFVFPKMKLSCNTVLSFNLSELFPRKCVYTNYKTTNFFYLFLSLFVCLSFSLYSITDIP